jgi:DNA segregation ATPase FtsK/SpoIIIE-like protein
MKININTLYSFLLALLSSFLFVIFYDNNIFKITLNSAGGISVSGVDYFILSFVDMLHQVFGNSIYMIPIVIMIYSYKLFFHRRINFLYLRLLALIFAIGFFSISLCGDDKFSCGIVGHYLYFNFNIVNSVYLLFILFTSSLLFLFASSISIQELNYSIALLYNLLHRIYLNLYARFISKELPQYSTKSMNIKILPNEDSFKQKFSKLVYKAKNSDNLMSSLNKTKIYDKAKEYQDQEVLQKLEELRKQEQEIIRQRQKLEQDNFVKNSVFFKGLKNKNLSHENTYDEKNAYEKNYDENLLENNQDEDSFISNIHKFAKPIQRETIENETANNLMEITDIHRIENNNRQNEIHEDEINNFNKVQEPHHKIENVSHKNMDLKSQNNSETISQKQTIKEVVAPRLEPAKITSVSLEQEEDDYSDYFLPLDFLQIQKQAGGMSKNDIKDNAIKLEQVMEEFGIGGKIVNVKSGPVVTLYEITIPAGVKTAKLISLEKDIALRMKAISVRIAPVIGKDVIGIELPNQNRKTVFLKEILQSVEFEQSSAKLPLALGFDINGKSIVADLASMPHVLIAGTTGSGKSVGVNAMILSLLYKLKPDECKLMMIDPKMLELSVYQDIPHLITPVVTNPKIAINSLKWVVKEMEHRYYLMSLLGVRNITGYNEKIKDKIATDKVAKQALLNQGVNIKFDKMPYIVVIIDEMADLMMVAGKEVESAVQRLAQMARASGIHLIMATQRPSVDVITGTIKANFPTRISFQVSSKIDSRTILGEQGAEQLLGRGDMLFMSGVGRIQRVHAPFISDEEVFNIVDYLKSLGNPQYTDSLANSSSIPSDLISTYDEDVKDELFEEAIEIIKNEGKASTSFLQRKFQIGYNRAARIMEQLEEAGFVSKASATGKREIL